MNAISLSTITSDPGNAGDSFECSPVVNNPFITFLTLYLDL